MLIRYYSHTPKERASIESMDGPAGRPSDNPPNSDGLGVYHCTVPELTIRVHWQPGPPIWQWFRLDPDLDPKSLSTTLANTSSGSYGDYQRLFTWDYDRQCFFNSLDDSGTTINPRGPRNEVACNDKPHTTHGACHSACFVCVHEQSWCNRLHQVLGRSWARSAIWREWKHEHWEESKTAKRGQC